MQCPNCSAAAEDGALECAACGVVFEKWLRKQAAQSIAAENAASAPASPPAGEGPTVDAGRLALPAAGFAVAGLFAFFALSAPSGQSVPSSAVELSGGFALKVPDGWEAAPADCDGATSPCTAAKVTKQADPAAAMAEATGGYRLTVSLTLFPQGPRAGAARDETVDGAYLPPWRAHVDRFTPGERKPATVDGLRALRVTGSGPKHVREEVRKPVVLKEAQAVALLRERSPGRTVITYQARMSGKSGDFVPEVVVDPGEYREADYELTLNALLVSSRRATLLVECRAQTSRRAECDEALAAFERGLRVTGRPSRLDLWTASSIKPER